MIFKSMTRPGLLIAVLLPFTFGASSGQVPDHFLYDSRQSQHFGAENIITVHRILYKQQDSLIPARLWDEDAGHRKFFAIGYRMIKLGLLDLQVDYLLGLTQHEVFGHGGRYREFGYTKSSYNLSLAFPFGNGSGFARSGTPQPGRLSTGIEGLIKITGGNEANLVLADKIVPRILSKNQFHYRESLLYLISKNNLAAYIWLDKLKENGPIGGGDMASYVMSINAIHASPGKYYTLDKLARQSLVSLLNPIQLYSAFAIGKTYVLDGNERMNKIPAIKIKNIRYLPAIGYNLTPFGSEFILDQYFISEKTLFHWNTRVGDNTFHSFWGGGVRVYNFVNKPSLLLSADMKIWHQPSMALGGKTIENTHGGLGFQATADVSFFPFKRARTFGLFTQAGYKTDGYVTGEQLNNGMIFRFGASLRAR
jgi:hypothetical protein